MDMPRDTTTEALDDAPDEALLVLYANGDRLAATALTRRLVPRVLGYAARLLSDRAEAEDVTQVTDRQRARHRRAATTLDDAPEVADEGRGAVAGMIEADRMAALDAALAQLPDRQRQAVVLRHLEGLSNPEIAAIMDIGTEAVESLTARGKRSLAAILSGQKAALGYEDEE